MVHGGGSSNGNIYSPLPECGRSRGSGGHHGDDEGAPDSTTASSDDDAPPSPPPTTVTTIGSLAHRFLYRAFLTVQTTTCVPFYSMAIWTGIYAAVFYCVGRFDNDGNSGSGRTSATSTSTGGGYHQFSGLLSSAVSGGSWLAAKVSAVPRSYWMRTALLAYFPCFCVFDRRPTIAPPPLTSCNNEEEDKNNNREGEKSSSPSFRFWNNTNSWFHFPYEWTQACRNLWFYHGVAEYFPVKLHKTVDLPALPLPSSTSSLRSPAAATAYLFLYHPHGVICMGKTTALVLNGCDFDQVFPHVKRRFGVTLNVSFWAPFFREWMMALGYVSANKETLLATLKGGNSVVLAPGGAAEAIHAHRDNFRLHVRDRRGFVRLALETNAVPVPCLGFGENEAFETFYPEPEICPVESKPKSTYLACQQKLCKVLKFSTPIITRLVPNPCPIHVVVGSPVYFEPGSTVEECHLQYLDAVRTLYYQHRDKYGYGHMDIEFV